MSQAKIALKKVKITDEDVITADWDEFSSEGIKNGGFTFPQKPHEDFKKVFQELVPHICHLAEQYDAKGNVISAIHDPSKENEPYMRCCGVHIGGKDEKETVVFTAVRYLSTGKAIVINTPSLYTSSDDTKYKDIGKLQDILKRLAIEATQFIRGEKYAPDPQGELFQEESEGEEQ